MDLYNSFMDIDDVIEYLNTKTDRKFNADKVIKFIQDKNIPIVFKYKGFLVWRFAYEGKYQSLSMKMDGYFNFRNSSEAIEVFTGSSNEIPLHEAIIHHLDSSDIRGDAPDGIKPEKGDIVLFKTGGRPPALTPDLTLRMKPEMNYPIIENPIKIYNNIGVLKDGEGKVGVLKVDLEEYLNNKRTETMDNETQIELLESKIEQLEAERTILKYQQTEALAAANAKIKQQEQDINRLSDQLNNQADRPTNTNEKEGQGDSLLILGTVMHCIQDAAKKNYTQELLIQVILEKYKSVSGISESTLKKKFPESKNYLNQRFTK